jgi:hypothetical protein
MSLNDLLYAFTYLALASLLYPVGMGLAGWPRLSPSFRVLTLGLGGYFLLLGFSLLSVRLGWNVQFASGYALSILYGITFTGVYTLALPWGSKRWVVLGLGLAAILYELADLWIVSGLGSLEGYSIPIMTLVLVISTLIFLYHLIRNPADGSLLAVPLVWVAGAKLLSGVVNGLLDLFQPQLMVYSMRLLIYLFIFTNMVLILCNVMYAIGIRKEWNPGLIRT